MSSHPLSAGPRRDRGFELTGRHVLAILVAFFGLVFAVNIVLVRKAVSTFAGTETETAYRDGLVYNRELAAARRQDALGWGVTAHATRNADGQARVEVEAKDASGLALTGLAGRATLAHPADKRQDRHGELLPLAPGTFLAEFGDTASGQWELVIEFTKGDERVFMSRNRIALP
jgi:nitrogen fixation protein FixH